MCPATRTQLPHRRSPAHHGHQRPGSGGHRLQGGGGHLAAKLGLELSKQINMKSHEQLKNLCFSGFFWFHSPNLENLADPPLVGHPRICHAQGCSETPRSASPVQNVAFATAIRSVAGHPNRNSQCSNQKSATNCWDFVVIDVIVCWLWHCLAPGSHLSLLRLLQRCCNR